MLSLGQKEGMCPPKTTCPAQSPGRPSRQQAWWKEVWAEPSDRRGDPRWPWGALLFTVWQGSLPKASLPDGLEEAPRAGGGWKPIYRPELQRLCRDKGSRHRRPLCSLRRRCDLAEPELSSLSRSFSFISNTSPISYNTPVQASVILSFSRPCEMLTS